MKASFTAKEYRQLLELVHLGMWIVTGYQGEDTAAAKRYYALDQKLLQLAPEAGGADLVEKHPDGSLQPAPKLSEDERMRESQSEFQNDVFWHELVTRLADRDLAGAQVKRAMDTPGIEPPAVTRRPAQEDRGPLLGGVRETRPRQPCAAPRRAGVKLIGEVGRSGPLRRRAPLLGPCCRLLPTRGQSRGLRRG